jgi:branched-chain amino acid transport system ATP-binding protein
MTTNRDIAPQNASYFSVRDLNAWYDEAHVLHSLNFEVGKGELATIVGRNGAGKTTTLKTIMAMVRRRRGNVVFEGKSISDLTSDAIARSGVGFCPEDRGIYSTLNVRENLFLPPVVRPGGMSVVEILELFPNLAERMHMQGTKLSGGEQQMLAVGRILRTGARLLLLDEPTEGLAPVIVGQIRKAVAALKERGFTVILVEQNLRFCRRLADKFIVMESGRIVDTLTANDMSTREAQLQRYLGL